MSELECPYCECHIDDEGECNSVDEVYDIECPNCGKNFCFTVDYIKVFYETEAPCLNGGAHKWRQRRGFPKEHFAGMQRCSVCGRYRDFDGITTA